MVAFTLGFALIELGISLTILAGLLVFRLLLVVFQLVRFLFRAGLRLLARLRQARSVEVAESDGRA